RPPSYFAKQLSPAAILHYYRSIADRSPLPVILYNIPQCVPYPIPIELVAELAAHPNIIAIKDSSGNLERIGALVAATANAPRRSVPVTQVFEAVTARMLQKPSEPGPSFVSIRELTGGAVAAAPPPVAAPAQSAPAIKTRSREVGFQVLCGSGSTVMESLEAGATGAILGCAAFAPQACQEIYLVWKDHDLALAREKQDRILNANRRIVADLGIAGIKCACDFNGYYGGRTRAPLLGLTAEEKREVEQILAEIRN
ncbi:MAG: dihydrodipicolinate synthase family protein, partial [Terracidiphilus sp.]